MLARVYCDAAPKGYQSYESIRLGPETAKCYLDLKAEVNALGGLVLSAGGTRSLTAKVTKGRSKRSMHYLGRAFDLPPYAGAFNPKRDPYLVGVDNTVYFRCDVADESEIEVYAMGSVKNQNRKPVRVRGRFASFTEIAARHGFSQIQPRAAFYDGHYPSMEWWHFEQPVTGNFLEWIDAVHGAGAHKKLPHWRELV